MLPHPAGYVRQHFVSVGQLNPKHGIRQALYNSTFDLYPFLLSHTSYDRVPQTSVRISGSPLVTATVCSKCAERLPSAVTTVQ